MGILTIESYFDSIVTHDEVQNKKPHPETFLTVCEELGIHSNEVLIVGDSQADLLAANTMKAKSVLFYPKKHEQFYDLTELKTLNPFATIGVHAEIITLLEKLTKPIL